MLAESVGHYGWAVMTSVAHQAQPVVHSLQVIDHGSLVLALIPAPGSVGYATEVVEGIWVMFPHQSHNLWRLRRWYHTKEFEALA